MIKNIRVQGYEFKIYSKIIRFPYKAYDAVIMDNKIITKFSWGEIKEKDPTSEWWRTIWCYDFDGNILWKVDHPYYINRDTKKRKIIDDGREVFSGVRYSPENKKFYAYNIDIKYELDPDTGKLDNMEVKNDRW